MRTPQRNFVVEYKSSRRRLGKLPNAIWGDTDFKALVDEAEADAPHLFGPRTPSETPGQDSEAKPVSELKTEQVDRNDLSALEVVSAPLTEIDKISEVKLDPASTDADLSLSAEKLSEPHLKREPKQRRKALPRLRVESETNALTASSSLASLEEPFDELASLEQENSFLKLMLAQRLHDENSLLRSLLERFESPEIS